MEEQKDKRWIQRYANYHKACGRLVEVTEADEVWTKRYCY